jgi:hypothetical protein
MTSKTDQKAKELSDLRKQELGEIELDVLARPFTLADAIREGSKVTAKEEGWGDGDKACALHAAVISAQSRNLM